MRERVLMLKGEEVGRGGLKYAQAQSIHSEIQHNSAINDKRGEEFISV